MENRLELNKKPVYELPDEVLIGVYNRNSSTPTFNPDLCLGCFGIGCIGKLYEREKTASQIWIKTDNDRLIDFIKMYDWRGVVNMDTTSRRLDVWKFKKIILEEFYGVNNGE